MTSSTVEDDALALKSYVKSYQDFPLPGIRFRDVFSVFQSADGLQLLNKVLKKYADKFAGKIDCVAMLDARGFMMGTLLALHLNVPCVPVRKKGKLPGKVVQLPYSLEYAENTLEIQLDSIKKGQRILLVDDCLATGGTLETAAKLIKTCEGAVVQGLVLMEKHELEGRKRLDFPIVSLINE